jgi:hypothetical protein
MNSKITKYTGEEFDKKFGADILDDEFLGLETPRIGMTWAELQARKFPKGEKIIFGLSRGQIGMLNATTNLGKTTFALNLTLSLASGTKFTPFTNEQKSSLRVMVIDGENTKPELQIDLEKMMCNWTPIQRHLVENNLFLVCDEYIHGEQLNLKNPFHLAAVVEQARDFKPDLIVVDTMAALFNLHNENDNAEVKRCVISPLKALGKEGDASILLLHHIGKQSEDAFSMNPAYSGRGGSNFGGLSRTVLKLTAPDKFDKSRVVFSVPKSKGYRQDDLLMKLDNDSRWFSVSDEPIPKPVSSYDEVVAFITEEVSKREIVDHFKGKFAERTVETNLKQAVDYGEICKVRQGRYAPIVSAETVSLLDGSGVGGNDVDSTSVETPTGTLKVFEEEMGK